MQKIYTKTGDAGTTSLLGGKRVSKNSEIIRLLGEIDELNSMLGLTKVELALNELRSKLRFDPQTDVRQEKPLEMMYCGLLERIQHELIEIAAQILFSKGSLEKNGSLRHAEQREQQLTEIFDVFDENTGLSLENLVKSLENEIDQVESRLPPLKSFVIPGGNRCSALLHVTRTVCRRTERSLVAFLEDDAAQIPFGLAYFNRLGDLLFLLARESDTLQMQESRQMQSC